MIDPVEKPSAFLRRVMDPPLTQGGFVRRKLMWQRRTQDTIFIIDAQKSNYSAKYFINVCLWLRAIDDVPWPAMKDAHVRSRLDSLLPPKTEDERKDLAAFNFSTLDQDSAERALRIRRCLSRLQPYIAAAESIASLRTSPQGQEFLEDSRSLIRGEALSYFGFVPRDDPGQG